MPDLFHFWSNDLAVSPAGDVAVVAVLNTQDSSTLGGNDEGTQRIYRRLMTGVAVQSQLSGEDIFAPNYGAGVPGKIGSLTDENAITGLITSQMMLEAVVAKSPPPTVEVTVSLPSSVFVEIQYVNAPTGQPVSLSFDPTQG